MLSLFWSGKLLEISHACGKLYVCTCGFGLCFMLQTNKAVAIRRLQPPPPKVTTSVHVIEWRLLFHSTILFSPFPHAYKAKLTKFTLMIQMMRLKLSGRGEHGSEVYQNQSHHHQEEDKMARADVLAFLLSG